MNENLSNQFVVVTKADYEAMVHEQAHKEAAALTEPELTDITSKGEVIKPTICNGERFLSRKDTASLLNVGFPTLWRWNKNGMLKAIKSGPRKVFYRYDDVLAMLKGELTYDD